MQNDPSHRPKVVIIGAGFGGMSAAKALANAPVEVTVIDRRNYHLFQPLLYQVATADLSPADVAWPIRGILARQKNARVALNEVRDIDLNEQRVIGENTEFSYDYLIVATGARHSYFGNDQWEPFAPGLKRIVDATEIRRRVLMAFERAELSSSEEEQSKELTFVVVGGGPTGVEMSGAIAELARFSLSSDFRRIKGKKPRVILIESGDRILKAFPEDLSSKAQKSLEKLGVELYLGSAVTDIDGDGVTLGDERIEASNVVWGAGVAVEHMSEWLDVETDRTGRVDVNPDLSLPERENVFVIGDAAKSPWKDGLDVPGIAPAAKQAGNYVAKLIAADLSGAKRPEPFVYKHKGNLATIGRNAAVIDFGWVKLSGFIAWWLWGLAHVYFLIGTRNRIIVAMNWFWSYVSFSKGARLVTGLRPLYAGKTKPLLSSKASQPFAESGGEPK